MTSNKTFKHSILLVDDEVDLLELTKYALSSYFEAIHTSTNVKDAIAILKANQVDLVLCDFRMPLQDGLELRNIMITDFPNVQFVMLTGFGDDQKIASARNKSNFEVLNKPTRPDVLVKRLLAALYGNQILKESEKIFVESMTKDEVDQLRELPEAEISKKLQKFVLQKHMNAKKTSLKN